MINLRILKLPWLSSPVKIYFTFKFGYLIVYRRYTFSRNSQDIATLLANRITPQSIIIPCIHILKLLSHLQCNLRVLFPVGACPRLSEISMFCMQTIPPTSNSYKFSALRTVFDLIMAYTLKKSVTTRKYRRFPKNLAEIN